MGFPGGSDSKDSACNAGDLGLSPGSGKSPGEGNGYLLQYSCLENSMDRGAWQAVVHGVAKTKHAGMVYIVGVQCLPSEEIQDCLNMRSFIL